MAEPVTDFDKLLASLEPAATRGESEWTNVASLSAAVSLKRIADVMEATARGSFNYCPPSEQREASNA